MSYSRWGESNFYTFWSSSEANQKEDELFECMYSIDESVIIKYSDIINILKYPNLFGIYFTFPVTSDEKIELLRYMSKFIISVNKFYKEKTLN